MGLVELIDQYNHSLEGTEVHDLDRDGNPDLTDAERQRYVELGHKIVALFNARLATRPEVLPLGSETMRGYICRPVVPVAMRSHVIAGKIQPVYVQPGFAKAETTGVEKFELAVRVPKEGVESTAHMHSLNSEITIGSRYYRTDWEPTRPNLTRAIDFAELLDDVIATLPDAPSDAQ